MSTVIPVSLSIKATKVLRVLSLYPPVPVFQSGFDKSGWPYFAIPQNYVRDNSIVSFGFPHSVDAPFTIVDVEGVNSVPFNAYALVLPSYLNGSAVDSYSIVLIDVDVAPIEPGISRLCIDYLDENGNSVTDYLDMPFYPKWDEHPREIEEIKEFAEEAITFLQTQIHNDQEDVLHVLNRMQTKGYHVSGQLYATKSNNTQPFSSAQAHSFEPNSELNQKFEIAKINLGIPQKTIDEKLIDGYAVVSYPVKVYAGQPFEIVMSQPIKAGDTLLLNGFNINATISDETFVVQLPNSFNVDYTFNLSVSNKGKLQAPIIPLKVSSTPYISNNFNQNGLDDYSFGDTVYFTGINFQNTGTIVFNDGSQATISKWSPSLISFALPNNLTNGNGILTTSDNQEIKFNLKINKLNYNDIFTVLPSVNLVSPGSVTNFQAFHNGNLVNANWSIENNNGNIGFGNISNGYVDENGNYTAPSTIPQTFSVAIAGNYSDVNGKYYAKSSLTVANQNSTLTISPSACILEPSFTNQFNVFYNNVEVHNVSYYLNGILNGNSLLGVIDQNGLYVAPAVVPLNQTIHLDVIYQNQTVTALIKIIPVAGSQDSSVSSHDFPPINSTTSASFYDSIAYSPCGVSNSSYPAPGVLTSKNLYTFYGGTDPGDCGSDFGVYMGQATDSHGKRCLVIVLGQSYYMTSEINAMWAAVTLSNLNTLKINGNDFSNPGGKKSLGYFTCLKSFANTLSDMAKDINAPANNTYSLWAGMEDAYNDAGYIEASNSGVIPVITLNGYYQLNKSFYPYAYNTSFTQNTYVNDNGGDLTYYLTDLITIPNGTSYYRTIVYPGDDVTSVTISAKEEVSTYPGIKDSSGAYRGFVATSNLFSNGGTLNLLPAGPPPPQISSVSQACPGKIANISGSYLSADSQAYFTSSNQVLPRTGPPSTSDGVHYTLSVTIPSNISDTPNSYPIHVSGSTGTTNSIALTIPSNCIVYPITLTVSPANTALIVNTAEQFTATLQHSDGTKVDVTDDVVWYVQSTQGGDSTNGFINNQGYYFSPADVPLNNPVAIRATYSYQNNALIGSTGVTIKHLFNGPPPPPPPVVHHGCYMLRVSPDTATVLVPGNPIQFLAQLYIDDANPQNVYAHWLINGIPGGNDQFGTIDANGLYTPPGYYPPLDTPYIKVEANYTVQPAPPDTNTIDLIGYSVVGFQTVQPVTGICSVTVAKQINVFFGDGRNGYVAKGTQISLEPGDYLFATYKESLNAFLLPYNDNSGDQSLNLTFDSAKANNLANVLYNEGTISQLTGNNIIENPNNIYTKPYTIVLGICDPNDGMFHSMWDLIPVVVNSSDTTGQNIAVQSDTCVLSHNLELKTSENPSNKLVNLINDKVKNISIEIPKQDEYLWTGKLIFDYETLEIKEPLKLFQITENNYNIVFQQEIGKWNIKDKVLFYDKTENALKLIDKNDNLDKLSVVAFYIDENVYSPWSFVNVLDNNEIVKESKNSIQIGNAIINWGDKLNANKLFIQTNASRGIKEIKNDKITYNDETEKNSSWISFGSL